VAIIDSLIILVYLSHAFWIIPREEKRSFDRLSKGVANPEKVRVKDRIFRVIVVFVTIFITFVNILSALMRVGIDFGLQTFLVVIFLHCYFYACDPLPPCRGKLWEKIAAWFAKPLAINSQT